MTEPFVSICIPTYNGEAWLKQCLDSCLNQSYTNYELVICDDGSTDTSALIIEEYRTKYKNISFFKNEKNLGLVANWNRCVQLSKGEWIKFVFQDDYITQNCLQRFVQTVNPSVPISVCARNFILPENASKDYIDYYTKVVRTLENTSTHKDTHYPAELIAKIAVENMCMNFIGEPSLIFFKKSITQELGFFNADLKQICDLEFALRVSGKYGLTYIPEKLCAFRIHNQSTTTTNVTQNYFQLHYIEPMVFAWLLLFDKVYMIFRSHLSIKLSFKLNFYFQWKCYQAYQVNLKENRQHNLFLEEQTKFKEIHQYKNGTPWVRLLSRLKK
ncbi:hypothetical protein CNR22_19400 [Sphingobacteriaceae bacterium]|nr:hypothetical protein CNR22_19400 [Sphingobacteriaceae bacterium]